MLSKGSSTKRAKERNTGNVASFFSVLSRATYRVCKCAAALMSSLLLTRHYVFHLMLV